MPWRRGEGVVGTAWEQDNTAWLDLANAQIRAVACLDDFNRLPYDLRLGMSYEAFQITRRDFRAVWATPIYDPAGQFLAVLSLNIDGNINMQGSELNAIIRPSVRDLAATIGLLAAGA
jgi:hypothetical protein